MLLPPFDKRGNLPTGVHHTSWVEFVKRFNTTPHRARLIAGLCEALRVLRSVGCTHAYIDGSFVTSKVTPGDYDALWDTANVDVQTLFRVEPLFLNLGGQSTAQKAKYMGEFYTATSAFLDFFQTDKHTGEAKGIVSLDLRGLP